MKIAVNVRFLLSGNLEGFGIFSQECMKRITRSHPEHEFIFFFDRPYDDSFLFSDNITPQVVYPPARHPLLWKVWFEYSIPYYLKKHKADVFLSLDGYASLKTEVPTIPVIHDLAFEHYPKDIPRSTANFYRKYFPKYAQKARRIATVSNYSKSDIVERYNIPAKKIDVVNNGASSLFHPMSRDEIKSHRQKVTGGVPYFFYVGAMHPRKNIANLLKAFDAFCKANAASFRLVLAGRKAWATTDIETTFETMEFKDRVIFTGRLSDEALATYMGAAHALTYVSYFEGFGIPVLEAMQSGVPVITAHKSSLPEVAGDAGIYADPFDHEDIAAKMLSLVNDQTLYADAVKKGLARSQYFSWDITAEKLWKCLMLAVQ